MFVDVETTGLTKSDVICSLAILEVDTQTMSLHYDLVNEGKKIPPSASSINNITNEMIAQKPPLRKSNTFSVLQKAGTESLFIAHNAPFELEMLAAAGCCFDGGVIDTLRVTKHLINDLESYALNFLRYEMRLYKKEEALLKQLNMQAYCLQPHNAQSDVIITKLLFDELSELATIDEMLHLSKTPVLLQKFEFGKYAGRYIEEISMSDPGYLSWMLHTIENLDEDLRYTLEYYL